jgi:AcrR family transcriptional regulator/DNA-binding MarR family transcriptional regulator
MAVSKRRSDVGAAQAYDEYARAQVAELQRARILTGMVEECFERGVGSVSVAHVVSRSGVSRRTFYEAFADREDCFVAAFEHALALARERVLDACEAQGSARDSARDSWRERTRAGLIAFLGLLEDEPRLGRLLVCESAAGGSRVLARRAETIEQLARAVDEGRIESKNIPKGHSASELSPLTAEGIVGGALAVIQARLLAQSPGPAGNVAGNAGRNAARGSAPNAARKGRSRPLLELVNPLMSTIVLPYLGPATARKELTRPVACDVAAAANGSLATGGALPADPFKAAGMRLTYRTVRVLMAIAQLGGRGPGPSNRQIGELAGVSDQGQISKLLHRLERSGLIENTGHDASKGMPNSWAPTDEGRRLTDSIRNTTTKESR